MPDPLDALRLPGVPVDPRPEFAEALLRRIEGRDDPAAGQPRRPVRTREERSVLSTVSIRYIVDDVDAAIDFYCRHLGFREEMHPDPAFAMLSRGDLRLVVVSPVPADHRGGGSRPMPDGRKQEPGGWNRFMLEVPDLEAAVEALRSEGVRFRNDIVTGVGSRQVMIEDPAGNPVELFEARRPEARLDPGPARA